MGASPPESSSLTGFISRRYQLKPLRMPRLQPDEETKTTGQSKEEVRKLRDQATNGLHFAAVVLSHADIQLDVQMAYYVTAAEREWHEEVSSNLKHPGFCARLPVENACGARTFPYILKTARVFGDASILEKMGLLTDFSGRVWRSVQQDCPEVWEQNRLANKVGSLVLAVIKGAMNDGLLWMSLCPYRFSSLLSDDDRIVGKCLEDMKHMSRGLELIADLRTPLWKAFLKRSCLQWTLVEETLSLGKDVGFTMDDTLRAQVSRLHGHPMSTLIAERTFQKMRDHERDNSSRQQSALSLWAKPVTKGVLCRDHKFEEVSITDVAPPPKSELPKSIFRPVFSKSSDKFDHLVGVGAPPWASPGASTWPGLGSDVDLLVWLVKHGKLMEAGRAWKSCLASTGMLLSKGEQGKVYFVLLTNGAMVYMWPASPTAVGKSTVWCLQEGDMLDLRVEPILDLEAWWCIPYEFASPLSLFIANGRTLLEALPSFAALQTGRKAKLLEHCAANAFFSMSLPQLRKLDKEEVGSLNGEATLPEVLSTMVQSVLKCNDEVLASILMKRCGAVGDDREELMQSEEVAATLDRQDQVENEQHARRSQVAAEASAQILHRVRLLRASAKAKGKQPRKAMHKWPASNKVSFREAEGMAPPNFYFWVDLINRRYRIFDPERVSLSRSWALHGEGPALKQCLEWAWGRYLSCNGGHCRVEGLLPEPAPTEGAAASTSG